MADHLFNQADVNRDQRLDLDEFRKLIAQSMGYGSSNFAANTAGTGQYTSSNYELSSSSTYGNAGSANAGYGDAIGFGGAAINGIGATSGEANYSSYEQSSYGLGSSVDASSFDTNASAGVDIGGFNASTSSSFGVGGFNAGASSNFGIEGFDGSASTGAGFGSGTTGVLSSSTFENNISQQQIQGYSGNPQNLYQDPNPQIIRRPAQGGALTYTQNIRVRFLQPPPVPPPGPLIIKEVRPPQPPPPPPLRVRQQAPSLPQPPALVLRERPPVPPASTAPQTVIRRLPALPVPPRSVVIERLPALPPRPRDIIIERWLPYAASSKRKTIVQRAEGVKEYQKPRNIIIQYEPVQVRVVRQFQRLGVTSENPASYVQRYGASLLDAQILLQQARAAGVVEDISPPNIAGNMTAGSTSFNAAFTNGSSGIEATGGVDFTSGGLAGASTSSFETLSYNGAQQGSASFSGFESAQGAGLGGEFSSSYGSNSFLSQGGNGTFADGQFNATGASGGYGSYGASTSNFMSSGGDSVNAAFSAADVNKDGALDANEFRRFISSQLHYW